MVSITGFQIVTSFFEAIIVVSSASVDSYSRKAELLVSRFLPSGSQEENDTSKDKVTLADSTFAN